MKHILIAEDEKSYYLALEIKLGNLGHKTTIATDGEEALKMLTDRTFDLLVLDIRMPKHDGYEILETLQKNGSKMPVIVLSNLDQHDEVSRAKALGATRFLSKSNSSVAEVIDAIKEELDARG